MSSKSTLNSQISRHEELARLLPLIKGITIIEYDGMDIDGSKGLYEYMLENGLSVDVIDRIIVCGKKTETLQKNIEMLREMFPFVEPEITHKEWDKTDFKALNICDVLVFHMATVVRTSEYDNYRDDGLKLHEIIKQTRQAYFACYLYHYTSYWDYDYDTNSSCLRCKLRLKDFGNINDDDMPDPTAFCAERQDYIKMCQETLIPKDLFFQCMDEVDHGCEECNQCNNYGKMKRCPFAQRIIATCYRQGIYVPQDEKIAHEWEAMASRQGYKPAHIQLADDMFEGYGCKQSTTAALEIYKEYARSNDEYCINRIIALAEVSEGKDRISAIPYMTQLAKEGNEDMILKLSDAFQNEDYGLPKDIVQQEEWIRQGAENGNPRFVKAMAEMYEANENWADSYKWYKKLEEVAPESLPENKLDEIELKMLTNGANDEEIAQKGMDYLYGYHGVERDTHLAFRCLNYTEKRVPLAKGLLGRMYYYGVGVKQSTKTGLRLLTDATKADDMLSMEKFIYVLHADKVEDESWTSDIINTIDREILKDNPYACYLKGKCCRDGRLYEKSDMEAFAMMQKAAEMGYPPAQYRLALMYFDGIGTQEDAYRYHQWIETSANNGHYEAEGVYGAILFNDWRNRSRAFKFLKSAFDQGYEDSEAAWCMAQCYMRGIGTSKDEGIAYPMYIKAAEEGRADAQVKLCEDYFSGNQFLSKDYTECARWGEAAIAQGKNGVRFETAYSSANIGKKDRAYELYMQLADEGNAAAMNNLGCLEDDESKAFEWFMKAAEKDDSVAQKNVARYYRYGIATDKDEQKALDYYIKSANQGYMDSILELASLYRNGYCTEKNIEESIKWYEKAVEKGNKDAMLDLASLYIDELDDSEKGIQMYKQAAEKGVERAILKLGEIYEDGIGVEVNTHKAIFWYRKAAANGNEEAKESLKRLKANWIVDGKIEDDIEEGNNDQDEESNDDLMF